MKTYREKYVNRILRGSDEKTKLFACILGIIYRNIKALWYRQTLQLNWDGEPALPVRKDNSF